MGFVKNKFVVLAACVFYVFSSFAAVAQVVLPVQKTEQKISEKVPVVSRATPENPLPPAEDATTMPEITDEEIDLLARAVYSEARGEPFHGQVAIAAVILNRVEHESFPDAIDEVIFQPAAFTAVQDGQFWLSPDSTAYAAVKEALTGSDPSGGAIYYYNPATATSKWIYSRPVITTIGKHVFAL